MLTLAGNNSFSFALFIADGFLNAVPGILLQLVAIPAIVMSLQRARLFPGRPTDEDASEGPF